MIRRKFFLSFIKELEWLRRKNRNGYELASRRMADYDIKKTNVPVSYEYVFLKNGKKSYKEFDYKSKDPSAIAVYANADMLLVKKPICDGALTLFSSASDKKQNAAQKRTALNMSALIFLGATLISTALARVIRPIGWLFLLADIVFILLALYNYFLSYNIKKYIEQEG